MHNVVLIIMYIFAWKKNGWILVDSHLNASGNVFAIGDSAWIEIDGKLATKTGLEAEPQAKYLARHFRNRDYGGDYRKVPGAGQHGQPGSSYRRDSLQTWQEDDVREVLNEMIKSKKKFAKGVWPKSLSLFELEV
jgi:NADH dehydrogenase FAD-containing subunit